MNPQTPLGPGMLPPSFQIESSFINPTRGGTLQPDSLVMGGTQSPPEQSPVLDSFTALLNAAHTHRPCNEQ